jgi:hypothetical protein
VQFNFLDCRDYPEAQDQFSVSLASTEQVLCGASGSSGSANSSSPSSATSGGRQVSKMYTVAGPGAGDELSG